MYLGVVADVIKRDVAVCACRRAARPRRRRECGARGRGAPSSPRCPSAREASGCSTRPSRALVERARASESISFSAASLNMRCSCTIGSTYQRSNGCSARFAGYTSAPRKPGVRRSEAARAERAVALREIAQLRPARAFRFPSCARPRVAAGRTALRCRGRPARRPSCPPGRAFGAILVVARYGTVRGGVGMTVATEPLELGVDEQRDELLERDLRRPAEPLARLRRVADEVVQLRLPALQRLVDVHVLAPVEPDVLERARARAPRRCAARRSRSRSRPARPAGASATSRARSRRRSPSRAAPSRSPSHRSRRQPELDRRSRVRNLARQELERPPRRLVVVEDPRAGVQAVAPAVRARDEVRVRLRDAVRRQRRERRLLVLRRLDRLAEDLRRRRLVEADRRVDLADRLEQRRRADGGELAR